MKNILILLTFLISTQTLLASANNFPYKKALLIENYKYDGYSRLPDNSQNITDLARRLTHLGFDVRVLSNLLAGEIGFEIEAFYQNSKGMDATLLYYSGYIVTESNERSVLLPIDLDADSPSSPMMSMQEVAQLAANSSTRKDKQNIVLFDAFFETKQSRANPQKSMETITQNQGVTISIYDAKEDNLLSRASNYIHSFINEIIEAQSLRNAFKDIDKSTGSISFVNTSFFTDEIFVSENIASAVHTEPAAVIAIEALDMPMFPFPPPKASASYRFEKDLFSGINNLTQSSERIENALKKSGYYEKSYYQIPNGYALVTRIEKMESDGTPAADAERWNVSDTGVGSSSFDILSYFKSLFFANEGHYRIIVFLVTSDNVQMTDRVMLMSEGQDFLSSGLNRLPPEFDAMPFTDSHYCTALIYEWYKVEHEEAKFMEPSKFLGQYHLAKNKFVEYLEAEK